MQRRRCVTTATITSTSTSTSIIAIAISVTIAVPTRCLSGALHAAVEAMAAEGFRKSSMTASEYGAAAAASQFMHPFINMCRAQTHNEAG